MKPYPQASTYQRRACTKMIVINWNCRGLSNPRVVPVLLELIHTSRPDVLFLFETLVSQARATNLKNRLGFNSSFAVSCNGHSGGLCVFWNDKYQCSLLSYSHNHIDMEVIDNDNDIWRLTGFYGFPERNRRRDSWNLLRSLADTSNCPWVVMGDFNDLLSQNEKKVSMHTRTGVSKVLERPLPNAA